MIIRKQDRLLYYDCLQMANEGDTRPFIRFIAHCTEKTLDVYLWATKEVLPKLGQDLHTTPNRGQRGELPKDLPVDSEYIKQTPDDGSEDSGTKFVFTSIDDNPLWEMAEQDASSKVVNNIKRNYIPPSVEDHILRDDEMDGAVHGYNVDNDDFDNREHLWFASDEDRIKVRGTGRFSRVVEAHGIFDDSESVRHSAIDDLDIHEDEDTTATIPRSS